MRSMRSPWWIVVGSVLGLIASAAPVMQFSFGVIVKPVSEGLQAERGCDFGCLDGWHLDDRIDDTSCRPTGRSIRCSMCGAACDRFIRGGDGVHGFLF